MNKMKLTRALCALASLSVLFGATALPASAQKSKTKTAKSRRVAAKKYECAHCKVLMSAADAKKHNFKCDCGMKLTQVKTKSKKG